MSRLARLIYANVRVISSEAAVLPQAVASLYNPQRLTPGPAGSCCQCDSQFVLTQQHNTLLQPFQGFAAHYAKAKSRKSGKHKAADTDDEDSQAGASSQPEFDPEPIERLMQQAVDHLQQELAGVRTGRAHPGLLENLLVDASGDHIPIKGCGTVTVRNPQLLAIVLFDPSLSKPVEKAIRNSPLSLNPTTEGSEVLVQLPRMTQETIDRMIKLVHMEAEGAHQSIRRARQKGMDAVKKAYKSASEDDKKRQEKEVQRLHDHYMAEVDKLKKVKDAELREHRD